MKINSQQQQISKRKVSLVRACSIHWNRFGKMDTPAAPKGSSKWPQTTIVLPLAMKYYYTLWRPRNVKTAAAFARYFAKLNGFLFHPFHTRTDTGLRNIIDKLAEFVARNGPEFESITKLKQQGNPRFSFLYGGDYYQYYQWRVASEQASKFQADSFTFPGSQ